MEKGLILEEIAVEGYEKIVRVLDESCGLDAIIAIHNTHLGAGVGGIRFRNYSSFEEALEDVLRLSKGMTYKFASLPCSWGGAKSVVITNSSQKAKNPKLLQRLAEAIESLNGLYIGAEDSGCSTDDLDIMKKHTSYLIGLAEGAGDPAPFTAWGTFQGIKAALFYKYGSSDLRGKTVAIQGVGAVGSKLAEHLFWAGAKLIISDVNQKMLTDLAQKFEATIVAPEEIAHVECDIFAPCAFGGILDEKTIHSLKCPIVAGAANNQLAKESDGDLLKEKNILYAPDFVINGGGALNCVYEMHSDGYRPLTVRNYVEKIYDKLLDIFAMADEENISTSKAAYKIAEKRLQTHALV